MTSTYEDNEMILNDDEDITISTSDESHERKRMAADFFREQSEVRTKIAEQQAIPMFTMYSKKSRGPPSEKRAEILREAEEPQLDVKVEEMRSNLNLNTNKVTGNLTDF